MQISIFIEGDFIWYTTGLNFGTPFIFNIYQWPTIKYSRSKLILYEDDTNVFFVDKNEEALQTKLPLVMKQLENWFF